MVRAEKTSRARQEGYYCMAKVIASSIRKGNVIEVECKLYAVLSA